MTTPIVRGFTQRAWIARHTNGELGWIVDEDEARKYAAKQGWRVAEYAFVREFALDRAAANEPPWEDLPEEPTEASP